MSDGHGPPEQRALDSKHVCVLMTGGGCKEWEVVEEAKHASSWTARKRGTEGG